MENIWGLEGEHDNYTICNIITNQFVSTYSRIKAVYLKPVLLPIVASIPSKSFCSFTVLIKTVVEHCLRTEPE